MDRIKWELGKRLYEQGLTGELLRHEAQLQVGYYLFYGDESAGIPAMGYNLEAQREQHLTRWIDEKHNGRSKQYNAGRVDIYQNIRRMSHWRPKNVQSVWTSPFRASNDRLQQKALNVLNMWIRNLEATGVKSARHLAKLTGLSRATIAKYRQMWEHLILPDEWLLVIRVLDLHLNVDECIPSLEFIRRQIPEAHLSVLVWSWVQFTLRTTFDRSLTFLRKYGNLSSPEDFHEFLELPLVGNCPQCLEVAESEEPVLKPTSEELFEQVLFEAYIHMTASKFPEAYSSSDVFNSFLETVGTQFRTPGLRKLLVEMPPPATLLANPVVPTRLTNREAQVTEFKKGKVS